MSFEVGRLSAKGGHAHVQVIPVPQSVSADTIADAFTSEGVRLGVDFEIEEMERDDVTGDRGYFRVELPDGRKLVHWMKDGVPFSIQFGRYVVGPDDCRSRLRTAVILLLSRSAGINVMGLS